MHLLQILLLLSLARLNNNYTPCTANAVWGVFDFMKGMVNNYEKKS